MDIASSTNACLPSNPWNHIMLVFLFVRNQSLVQYSTFPPMLLYFLLAALTKSEGNSRDVSVPPS